MNPMIYGTVVAAAFVGIALIAYYLQLPRNWEQRLSVEEPSKKAMLKMADRAGKWRTCAVGEIFNLKRRNELSKEEVEEGTQREADFEAAFRISFVREHLHDEYKPYFELLYRMGAAFTIQVDNMCTYGIGRHGWSIDREASEKHRKEAKQILKELYSIQREALVKYEIDRVEKEKEEANAWF